MFIVIVCYPVCDFINFEIYLSFFIKVFQEKQKSQNKNLRASKMK